MLSLNCYVSVSESMQMTNLRIYWFFTNFFFFFFEIEIDFFSKLDHHSREMNFTSIPDRIQAAVAMVIAIWMVDAIESAHNTMVQTHLDRLQHRLMTSSRTVRHASDVVFLHDNHQHRRGKIVNRRVVRKIMAISIAHCCDDAYVNNSKGHGNNFQMYFSKLHHLLINNSNIRVSFFQ